MNNVRFSNGGKRTKRYYFESSPGESDFTITVKDLKIGQSFKVRKFTFENVGTLDINRTGSFMKRPFEIVATNSQGLDGMISMPVNHTLSA